MLFGEGGRVLVSSITGDIIIHNVLIALAAQYGIFALIAGLLINIALLFCTGRFFLRYLQADRTEEKIVELAFFMAGLVASLFLHVSSAVDNFFTIGEWICLMLVLVGTSRQRRMQQ